MSRYMERKTTIIPTSESELASPQFACSKKDQIDVDNTLVDAV
jgi:hypothetical protein